MPPPSPKVVAIASKGVSSAKALSGALSRVRGNIQPKLEALKATRDIRLGLERISHVVSDVQKWDGIHVGGTNGKGSICAYLSGLFELAGVSYGRYVSPAFPEKRNAITVNGQYPNRHMYDTVAGQVYARYRKLQHQWRIASQEEPGPLSPFEAETATAFRILNLLQPDYGIIEVGMGGATDATNAMRRKSVTVISKIDLDHQEYLGNTLRGIAWVKAGIMRPGVPCIVDDTNSEGVIDVLRKHARKIGTRIILSGKGQHLLETLHNERWQLEDYQIQNLLCAALAFRVLFPHRDINLNQLLETNPSLPGRLEKVDISELTGGKYKQPILADAAHNLLGMQALARHVDSKLRNGKPVTWVMGLSSSAGKPIDEMIKTIIQPQDRVAFVEYSRRENQPPPTIVDKGREILQEIVLSPEQIYSGKQTLRDAIRWAASRDGQVVVTGSLYLLRDFYELDGVRGTTKEIKTRLPGVSQLWRLCQIWKRRPLTVDEFADFEAAKKLWFKSTKFQQLADSTSFEKISDDSIPKNDEDVFLPSEPAPGRTMKRDDETQTRYHLPAEIREELSKLDSEKEHHRQQLRLCEQELKRVREKIDREKEPDVLSKLSAEVKVLRADIEKHEKARDEAIDKIRTHPDAAKEFGLTYYELFGRHRGSGGGASSLFAETAEPNKAVPAPGSPRKGSQPRKKKKKKDATTESEPQPQPQPKDFWGRPENIGSQDGSSQSN